MKHLRLLSVPIALLALVGSVHAAESTIKFSDPSQPGTLSVRIAHGEVNVQGDDVDEVTVETDSQFGEKSKRRADGLRVISSHTSFGITENDNHIVLEYGLEDHGAPAEFDIRVPHNTHINLEISYGGEITVENISGDVTVKGLNGEVDLENLSGGAIVETMNGEIEASFTAVHPDRPLSFTSMNGEVELHLPADAAANVRFRSQNGSIMTDFDEDVLVTTTTSGRAFAPEAGEEFAEIARDMAHEAADVAREIVEDVRVVVNEVRKVKVDVNVQAPRAPRAPRPPSIPALAGGKVISGTLNGGGVDLQVATMNGDIIVRKND